MKRAELLLNAGAPGKAWAAGWAVIAMLRTDSEVRRLLSETAAAQESWKFEEAIAKLSAVIALRPESFTYRLQRSDLYLWTKQSEKAFADIAEARRLNPLSTEPLRYLGNAYEYVLEPGKAVTEIDAAIARDPENGDLYRDRGLINFKLAHPKEAAQDFSRAVVLNFDPYSMIWLLLSNGAAGLPDSKDYRAQLKEILAEEADETGAVGWPYPVLQLFGGVITEKDMQDAAQHAGKDSARRDQRCEALFYAGLNARQHGEKARGLGLIQQAHALCHPGFIEYIAASWELAGQQAPQRAAK